MRRSVQCICGKTADRIRMPFGVISRTGPGIRHVVGFGDRSTGRGTFGGEFGVRRCNQRGLTFAATRPSSQITLGRLVDYTAQIWKGLKYISIIHTVYSLNCGKHSKGLMPPTGKYCTFSITSSSGWKTCRRNGNLPTNSPHSGD